MLKLTPNQEIHKKRVKEAREHKQKLIKLHVKYKQDRRKARKIATKLQRLAEDQITFDHAPERPR